MDASHGSTPSASPSAGVSRAGWPDLPVVPGFDHRYVETPGLTSHVAVIGQGEPVVMLHGLPQHWWQWRAIAPALARRYQVFCPDLRGFGWTQAHAPGMGRMTQTDDVLGILDALQLDRVRVVAHDMGALTAAHLAYVHPDRVRAMAVLAVPPPFMPFSVAMLPALRHIPPLLFHRRGQSLAHVFDPPYVVRPLPSETVDAYLAPQVRPDIEAAINEVYRWLVFSEMPRMAGGAYRRRRLAVPSLYAFGAEDRPLTAEFVRGQCKDTTRFADHLEIAEVPGAAHFMTDDNPDAISDLLLDFFARVA